VIRQRPGLSAHKCSEIRVTFFHLLLLETGDGQDRAARTNNNIGGLPSENERKNSMTKFSSFKSISLVLGCATVLLTSNSVTAAERCFTLKGEFDTAIQVLPPLPSFPPEPFQPILHLIITATGNLSHFGRATGATTDQAVDVSVNPNRGTAHWVFQNPNGDALLTEADLSGTPLDASGSTQFHGTFTVIGGSGKFEGATGLLQFQGNAQGNSGFFSVEGTICVTSDDEGQ
jgi:hypothetical protein